MLNNNEKIVSVTPAALELLPYEADTKRFHPIAQFRGNMEEYDYVEEEYLASGVEGGRPFTTWIMIRRPKDPAKFSGTVVVEPLHFFGNTPIFAYTAEYILRSGHGWVGVGSQKTSVYLCVKETNPERYEKIHIETEPLSERAAKLDYRVVSSFPDEEGNYWWEQLNNQNRASKEILAQVGAAVKNGYGVFEHYGVKQVILGGHSYTGYVSTCYIREAHHTMRMEDGSPIYDGLFPSGWPTTPFEPRDVPLVQCITEGDICSDNMLPYRILYSGMDYRRSDSDMPEDRYRLYEFAGVSHTSMQHPPVNDIKFLEKMDPTLAVPKGARSSMLPFNELHQMALDHLIKWVADGTVPPKADRIKNNTIDFFEKDEHGNTLGGIRCVQMDVPAAKYVSNTYTSDGKVRFGAYGMEEPFSKDKLIKLYGDKETYITKFKERLEELITEGWYLSDTADVVLAEAQKVEF